MLLLLLTTGRGSATPIQDRAASSTNITGWSCASNMAENSSNQPSCLVMVADVSILEEPVAELAGSSDSGWFILVDSRKIESKLEWRGRENLKSDAL
jgi:hypothetical protein